MLKISSAPRYLHLSILLVVSSICVHNACVGQVIKGTVVDADDKSKIPLATISLIGIDKNKSEASDSLGFFFFDELTFGRYNLKVTCVGYEPTLISSILATNGKQTDIEVYLKPSNDMLEGFLVKGTGKNNFISAKSLNIEQTEKYAVTWGDPARMALSFAGVSNLNDQSNELVIRGNSPKGLLWMIEGVEVPSPNHFSAEGASGGLIGALSSTVLKNSTFYTGAFPSNYGNALSGVFDISLRDGNSEVREYSLNTSLLGFNIGLEGPFSKKHKDSYLLNYRFANAKLINSLGLSKVLNASSPKFEDLTFKLKFQRNKSVLTLWGVGGRNTTDFSVSTFLEIQNQANFYASGLKWSRELSDKFLLESAISYSGNQNLNNRTQIFTDQRESRKSNIKNQNIRLVSNAYYRFAKLKTLHVGTVFSELAYDLFGEFNFNFNDLNLSVSDTSLSSAGRTYSLQNFGQFLINSEKVDVKIGVHSFYFFLNNQFSLEPRTSLSIKLNEKQIFNIGAGLHSRLEPLNVYLFKNDILLNGKIVDNTKLGLTKAAHFVVGFNDVIKRKLRISSEIYYQQLFNVPVGNAAVLPGSEHISLINQINSVNLYPLSGNGFGRNYGWELTVEKPLDKGYYGLFTSSLFRSFYQNSKNSGRYPSRYDNRFVINALGGKEWIVNKNLLNLNLRATWAGGIRQLPTNIINGSPNTDNSVGYVSSLGNYFKIDVKGNYIFSIGKTTTTVSIDINNILDRANPLARIYSPVNQKYEIINQLGILPVLSAKFDF